MNPQTGENETEEFFPLFRPYVFYFLKEMSKYYEIIAFTAAQSTYANAVVSILNKDDRLLSDARPHDLHR